MAAQSSWRDLQRAYLAFLNDSSSSRGDQWLAVWQGFCEHSYFRRRMLETARATLRSSKRTAVSEQELIATALMTFAKRIQSRCDTKSIVHIRDKFRGWLGSALIEACRSARSSFVDCDPQPHGQFAVDPEKADAIHIWAHAAVARLRDPQRSILLLYLCGLSPRRIAEKLDLEPSQVRRMIRGGVKRLLWRARQQRCGRWA